MSKQNWQKIYLDHSPKLLGICRRYIADLQTAEDLLQDSFILAMQKSHQLNDEKALFGWLRTIVVNNALQYLRSSSIEIFVSTEISEIPESSTEMNTTTENNQVLAYDFTREELLKSIDNLPLHHRSVFNLYFIEKNSHQEISKLLGININTSKSHLLRAKKSVQSYLMNNIANQNTPKTKKKTTQLLIFLGFGGLAWAQTFQNKFADFSIAPSKELIIPRDTNLGNISFSGSNKNFQKKLMIAATLFITLIVSIVAHKESRSIKQKNPKTLSSIKTEKASEHSENLPSLKTDTVEKNNFSDEKQNEISSNEKKENKKIISKATLGNEKKSTSKDSAELAPKKIIIVKKIIQRDTIFIER